MSDIRYEFIMSQIKHIRDIKEDEKTKISLVYYEGCQGTCILKICKDRDLSEVYQALMETKHPHVAEVYDCIYEDGNTYVVEEHINGQTVAEIIAAKGIFSEDETTEIMTELCDGLDVLHHHEPPIIHNDIKASNIMITEDGKAKLFDFDISRTYKEESYKNTKLMGTYEYAAPEHYGFGQSDPRTDIYSLGVTMHEMLTGVGLNQEHDITYQGGLAPIIQKCVEIDRKKRYGSAASLKTALEKQKKKGVLWRRLILCVCIVLLLLLGGILLSKYFGEDGTSGKNTETSDSNKKDGSEAEDGNSSEDRSEIDDNSQMGENAGTEDEPKDDQHTEIEGGTENKEEDGSEEDSETGGNSITGNGTNENGTNGTTSGNNDGNAGESEGKENNGTAGNTGNTGTAGSGNNSSTGSDAGAGNNPTEDKDDTDTTTEDAEIIYQFRGTAKTMATWADGTGVVVEYESGKHYLRSTTGKETSLAGLSAPEGWSLYCHQHTNQMYLFLYDYTKHSVYSVNQNLEIKLIKTLEFTADDEWFLFMSNGALVYYHKGIILDGKSLTQIDKQSWFVKGVPYMINDTLYSLYPGENGNPDAMLEWNTEGTDPFLEGGFYNELVNEYPMTNISLGVDIYQHAYAGVICSKSDGIYFVATMNGEKALVRFDGKKYEAIAYMKDYKGSENYGSYYALYVTDTAFGFYDEVKNAVVEFTFK